MIAGSSTVLPVPSIALPRAFVRPIVVAGIAGLAAIAVAGFVSRADATSAEAESLLISGRYDEADSAFARVLGRNPADTLALVRRGTIALHRNRTLEARRWLALAGAAGATRTRLSALTAECFYRENAFDSAAAHLRRSGREASAAQLASLHGRVPYRISGPPRAELSFVQTDPLPLVELTVNGRGPLLFLIDTGAGELVLDPAFADSVGAPRFGEESGTFAGGQKRPVGSGTVDSVRLGLVTVRDVPIRILDTSRFSGVALGRRVAGLLGTTLLSRFVFTLDYAGGKLVLARRGGAPPAAAPGVSRTTVPIWLAGDHYILARGAVGTSGPLTWLVDTGLAGAAFTGPASVLAEAGIALEDTTSFQGQGGGGAVKVIPFQVPSLRIGTVEKKGLLGMLGPFPPSLERGLGTRVAGIVSHAFFQGCRVEFDFDRMEMTIERPS